MDSRSGLIVVQIDGMSGSVLDDLLSSGHMPTLQGLVSSGRLTLDRWVPLLPPCTPASQAGILHGRNPGIPGFRWYEKETDRLFIANHAKDAAEIERRLSDGKGILSQTGVSVGNLLAGDAAFSHLTMATIEGRDDGPGPDDHVPYPIDPIIYVRIVFGSFAYCENQARAGSSRHAGRKKAEQGIAQTISRGCARRGARPSSETIR